MKIDSIVSFKNGAVGKGDCLKGIGVYSGLKARWKTWPRKQEGMMRGVKNLGREHLTMTPGYKTTVTVPTVVPPLCVRLHNFYSHITPQWNSCA